MDENRLTDGFRRVREVSYTLSSSSLEERNKALSAIRDALSENRDYIFSENAKDIERARGNVSDSALHRLLFDEDKLRSVLNGIDEIITLPDPLGRTKEKRELDEGFILEKRTFPIGVIGMVFESRPDALVQIASLALKSGNGLILKGGKEANCSNIALSSVIRKATECFSFGSDWLLLLLSHSDVDEMLRADKYIDLLIPRGSNSFVRYVMDNTRIPVMGHADGICSVYIDESADLELALKVAVDSKIQYPAACNAAETFLVNEKIAASFIPRFEKELKKNGVVIHADKSVERYLEDFIPATEDDFHREYLALECAIKSVKDVDEAISHINSHGSHHTDAIITEDNEAKERFFSLVDSADVFCNCSTRFADGFRFGLGAEVGISTSKLHARGPVGLDGLTTTKWLLNGNGETVKEYSGKNAKSFKHRELM